MPQDDYDTNMGWWTDKPERPERSTSFSQLQASTRADKEERVWLKAAVILMIMVVFGWSMLRLAGLVS